MTDGPFRSIRREGDEVVIRLPLTDAHGLRVALAPCPCRGPKARSAEDIRNALAKGLARAVSMPGWGASR